MQVSHRVMSRAVVVNAPGLSTRRALPLRVRRRVGGRVNVPLRMPATRRNRCAGGEPRRQPRPAKPVSSRFRPAAVRPTRPLPRAAVCAAMEAASFAGSPGNIARISFVILATRSRSCSARATAPRARAAARASASAKHSRSACSTAACSTRMPCLSYRPLDLLNRTTTAVRLLYFVARRVSAASPASRYSSSPIPAQARQSGCSASR